jgi:2-haloacid dehalogenase
MLNAVVHNSGIAQNLESVLSADSLGIYKPDPRVYRLAVDTLGIGAERVGFVSSNCWDACGAQSFGFHAFWINRMGAPVDRLDANPEHILTSLADLLEILE